MIWEAVVQVFISQISEKLLSSLEITAQVFAYGLHGTVGLPKASPRMATFFNVAYKLTIWIYSKMLFCAIFTLFFIQNDLHLITACFLFSNIP